MTAQYEAESSFEQHEFMSQHQAGFKRSSWPATAVLQRPAPPPPFLSWFDRKLLAAVLSILLACLVLTANDYGLHAQPLSSSAHLSSPSSVSYNSIAIHSTVLDLDLAAEVLLLQVKIQQQGPGVQAACSGPQASHYEVAVGTAYPVGAPPSAVLPLCNSSRIGSSSSSKPAAGSWTPADTADAGGYWQLFTVPIPLRHSRKSMASPWEELIADVKFTLRCAGSPCSHRDTPGVIWTALWTSSKMRMQVERHVTPTPALFLMDAADLYPVDESKVPFMEALRLHQASPDAAFRLGMTRHHGVRVLQLLAALVQLGFIVYCLMMGAGQLLWAYVLHRFLTVRMHGGGMRRHSQA